jgi:predicted acetyltransferase
MKEYFLAYPTKAHEKEALAYIEEFRQMGSKLNGTGGLDRISDYDEWLQKLAQDLDLPNIPADKVPAHTYFLMREGEPRIYGMINIRHNLNDYLLREGGHIGYSIRPTERRKGLGALQLSLGLQKCRELGLPRVLVTCDKSNPGSAGVIRNNGGVLENEIPCKPDGELLQRYWISL